MYLIFYMKNHKRHTLSKKERLNSVNLIEKLFSGGSKSLPAFPLRIVYMLTDNDELPIASVLISVSKKHFKYATKRNRIKRQIREAYRKYKYLLIDHLSSTNQKIIIAFIWLDNKFYSSKDIEGKIKKLLQLTVERIS